VSYLSIISRGFF